MTTTAATTALVRCEAFGDGCSYLVAASSVSSRRSFGDVVPEPAAQPPARCPECGKELLRVEVGQ